MSDLPVAFVDETDSLLRRWIGECLHWSLCSAGVSLINEEIQTLVCLEQFQPIRPATFHIKYLITIPRRQCSDGRII